MLNSETIRAKIAVLQSRGRFGARDFDKLVFELAIPRFDARDPVHRDLVQVAREAERAASTVDLAPDVYFVRARRIVRLALQQKGLFQRLEALVAKLVP